MSTSTQDLPYSADFLAMLDAAPQLAAIAPRDADVFRELEAAIARHKPAHQVGVATELALATWTTYLVKHPKELAALELPANTLAAALYLAMDLHLSTGESIEQVELLRMFELSTEYDDALYEQVATHARPIFSYLSGVTPDVLSVIIKQFRDHRHALNHTQHARELAALASAFWSSEPALDVLTSLPRSPLILRVAILPHQIESHDPDTPEPSCFFSVSDAQSDAPRALLPWYGELSEMTRLDALRRALLEAIFSPHQGEAAIPVAVIAPSKEDVKPLTLKLGIPEIVVLAPEQMGN